MVLPAALPALGLGCNIASLFTLVLHTLASHLSIPFEPDTIHRGLNLDCLPRSRNIVEVPTEASILDAHFFPFEPVPAITFDVPATIIVPVGSDVAFPVETGLILFAQPSSPASFGPYTCNWHRESNPLKELLKPHAPRTHWSTTQTPVSPPLTPLLAIFESVRDFVVEFFEFSAHGLEEMGIYKIAACIFVLTWACVTLGDDSGEPLALEYSSAASGEHQEILEQARVTGNNSSEHGEGSPNGGAQCGMAQGDGCQPDGGSTPPSPSLDGSQSEELSADSTVDRLCASPSSPPLLPASGSDNYQRFTLPSFFLHFRVVPLAFLWALRWSLEWSEDDMDILAQSLGLGPFEMPPDGLLQRFTYLAPSFSLASLIDEWVYRPSFAVLVSCWSYLCQQWSRTLPHLVDALDFVMEKASFLPLALFLINLCSKVVQSSQYAQVLSFAATVHHCAIRLASQSRYYGLIQSYLLGLETCLVASSLIVPCVFAATEELLAMVAEAVWKKEFGADWRRPGAHPRSRPQKGFPWKLLVKHCWADFRSVVAPPLGQLKRFIVLDVWPVLCAVGTLLRTSGVIMADASYIVATVLYISSVVLAKIVARALYLGARALACGSARALLASLDLTEQYELWRVRLQHLSPMWRFLPDLKEKESRPNDFYQESPSQQPEEPGPVQQEGTAQQKRPLQQDQLEENLNDGSQHRRSRSKRQRHSSRKAKDEAKDQESRPEVKEEQPSGGKILYYNLDERRALRGSTYFNPKSTSSPRDFRPWVDPHRGDKRYYPVAGPSRFTPPSPEAEVKVTESTTPENSAESPAPDLWTNFRIDGGHAEAVVNTVETPLEPEVVPAEACPNAIDDGRAEVITTSESLLEPEVPAEPCANAIDEGHADSEVINTSESLVEAIELYKDATYEDYATAMARLDEEYEEFLREGEPETSDVDLVVPDLSANSFDESYTEVINTFESLLGVSQIYTNSADEDDSVAMARLDQELEDAFGEQTATYTSNWDIFTPLPRQPHDAETPEWLTTRTPPPIAFDKTEPPTPCASISSSPGPAEQSPLLELDRLTDLNISGGRVTPPTPTPLGRSPPMSLAELASLAAEGTPVSTTTYDYQSEERNRTPCPKTPPTPTWTSGLAESRWSPLNCPTGSLESAGVDDYNWSPESRTPPVSPPTPGESSNELLSLRERALLSRRGRAPSPPGTQVPVESSTELCLRERALLSRRGRAPSPPGTPVESSTELVLRERAPSPWTPPTPGESSTQVLSLRQDTPSPNSSGSCSCSTLSTTPKTTGPIRRSSRKLKGKLTMSPKVNTVKMLKKMEKTALSVLDKCGRAKDFMGAGRDYGHPIQDRSTRGQICMEEVIETGVAVEARFVVIQDEEPLLPSMESIEQELVDIAVLDGIAMKVDDPSEMLPKLHPGAPMEVDAWGYYRFF